MNLNFLFWVPERCKPIIATLTSSVERSLWCGERNSFLTTCYDVLAVVSCKHVLRDHSHLTTKISNFMWSRISGAPIPDYKKMSFIVISVTIHTLHQNWSDNIQFPCRCRQVRMVPNGCQIIREAPQILYKFIRVSSRLLDAEVCFALGSLTVKFIFKLLKRRGQRNEDPHQVNESKGSVQCPPFVFVIHLNITLSGFSWVISGIYP